MKSKLHMYVLYALAVVAILLGGGAMLTGKADFANQANSLAKNLYTQAEALRNEGKTTEAAAVLATADAVSATAVSGTVVVSSTAVSGTAQ